MGFSDRDYSRDRPSTGSGFLDWILFGQVPLFRVFGIRVAAHSSLVIYVSLALLTGFAPGWTFQDRVIGIAALFVIILLHEFGHCFAARGVGGEADDIVMHPLGGLALCHPPHRPLAVFLTILGGPMVNVLICLGCGIALYTMIGTVPWDPFSMRAPAGRFIQWTQTSVYVEWFFRMSWSLLVFNLLPIFPLDGGCMLQAILWPRLGYGRSMLISVTVGLYAAIVAGCYAIATAAPMLLPVAIFCGFTCWQVRRQLLASPIEDGMDYNAAASDSRRAIQREQEKKRKQIDKIRQADAAEQAKVDQILAKVSAEGMHSLNWLEKRILQKATENQRKRQVETNRRR